MSIWKKLFKRPSERVDQDDDAHNLEWRNRFLAARVEYLTKKLKKSGRGLPPFDDVPEDPEARNEALQEQVKRLENMF